MKKNIEKQLGRLISTIEHYNFPGCQIACSRSLGTPVCGTDGKTYIDVCHLKRVACETQNTDLAVASKGKCAGITLYHQHIDLRSLLTTSSYIVIIIIISNTLDSCTVIGRMQNVSHTVSDLAKLLGANVLR